MSTAPEPFLVRLGVRYFRALGSRAGRVESEDEIHVLNDEERARMRAIVRGAVTRAAIAGAITTTVAATAEVLAQPLLGPDPDNAPLAASVRFWAIAGGVALTATALEIAYLYWASLRAVHDLSRAAGLDLFPEDDEHRALAGAMARAALELPNPAAPRFGVNPRRESSKLRLLVASLVYKAKISLTNFAAKTLVRRMLGRAFVRTLLPYVAVPLTATWTALVCYVVLREARIRAMGPSAAREMIDLALGRAELGAAGREAALRAVASCIVRTEDMHPNLAAVLVEVKRRVGLELVDDLDDTAAFLRLLAEVSDADRRVVLRVLAVGSVIDGRLTRRERKLVVEAYRVAGLAPRLGELEALRRAFVAGAPTARERVEAL